MSANATVFVMDRPRRHILVTGASRGIGRAVVLALSQAGWPTICWSRSQESLEALADAADGPRPTVRCVDLTDPASIRAGSDALGKLDVPLAGVILNAGAGRWKSFDDQSFDDWRYTQAVNVDGHYQALRYVMPRLKQTPGATIIGMLSDSALYPFADRTAYAASKAALRMLLDSLRREVRPHGIRVGMLFPSRVDTYFQGSRDTASPGARLGSLTSEDVAAAIVYMLDQPPAVEIREIHLGAVAATYGPFDERVSA